MLTQIQALIALLADDSPTVLAAVTNRLLELGEPSLRALRRASDDRSPLIRMRARGLVNRLLRPQRLEELVERTESASPNELMDLEDLCIGLARIHSPDIEDAFLVAQLDELAEKIRPELEGAETERIRIEAFLTSIHDTLRFRVSMNDWSLGDHFLHTVIERRCGLPLNIAIIYALLGRRLGLSIQVIGSPIRAMAFTIADGEDLYLDPQHNDSFRLLTRTGAEWFLIRQGLVGVDYDRFLPRLSVSRVLQRNVRNIVNFCDDVNNMEMKSLFQDLIGALSRQRMANELIAHQDATE